MKHALLVLAVVAVLGGGLVLLPLLAWARAGPPRLLAGPGRLRPGMLALLVGVNYLRS
jgi:hypothetical protein